MSSAVTPTCHLRATMLWATATGWLGALAVTAVSWLTWITANATMAFFRFLDVDASGWPAPTDWPAVPTAACAALGLAASLAVAWLIGRSPALLPSWLAGLLCGVIGCAVGFVALRFLVG